MKPASKPAKPKAAPRVHFQEAVEVVEYSRLVGAGGGVPNDAGASLGLGEERRKAEKHGVRSALGG